MIDDMRIFLLAVLLILAAPSRAGDDVVRLIEANTQPGWIRGDCKGSWELEREQFDAAVATFDAPPRAVLGLTSNYLGLWAYLAGRIDGKPALLVVGYEVPNVQAIDEEMLARFDAAVEGVRAGAWGTTGRDHPSCGFVLNQGTLVPIDVDALDEAGTPLGKVSRELDELVTKAMAGHAEGE